jgi:SulP family sulfate permease
MNLDDWLPKSVQCLRGYDRRTFVSDLVAGIDATGMAAIEELADALHTSGRALILCGMREQPARFLRRAGFAHHIGARNVCASVDDALTRAREIQRTHEWW